jgi:hypothetical protein
MIRLDAPERLGVSGLVALEDVFGLMLELVEVGTVWQWGCHHEHSFRRSLLSAGQAERRFATVNVLSEEWTLSFARTGRASSTHDPGYRSAQNAETLFCCQRGQASKEQHRRPTHQPAQRTACSLEVSQWNAKGKPRSARHGLERLRRCRVKHVRAASVRHASVDQTDALHRSVVSGYG